MRRAIRKCARREHGQIAGRRGFVTVVDGGRYWLMALGEESRVWDSCHAERVSCVGDYKEGLTVVPGIQINGGMRAFARWVQKRRWITVVVATILQAALAGVFEFLMSGGTSGWIPLWAGLLGGVVTAGVLLLIPSQKEVAEERVFVQRSANELVQQVSNRTSVAARFAMNRYARAWMRAGGPVYDVVEHQDTVLVYVSGYDTGPGFVLEFKKGASLEQLKVLDPGDTIRAIGRISQISALWIRLVDCEIDRLNAT